MTSSAKPLMRPSLSSHRPSFEVVSQAVNEHAAERGIPTSVPTPPPSAKDQEQSTTPAVVKITKKEKGAATAEQTQSPTKRLSVDIPDYLRAQLRKKSADTDNTIKYLICRALKKDGFHVEPRDLIEDGRREH
jgi:hypothetical protein